MLPRVKIYFENGALGSVAPSADGVVGLVSTALAVPGDGMLQLATPYVLRKLDDLVKLGVTAVETDANAFLYRNVKKFYDESGDGAELWIMGFPNTEKQSDLVDKTKDDAKLLIQAAGGRLRCLAVAFNPDADYKATIIDSVDDNLFTSMLNAQALAEWATDSLYAPLFVLLEARSFSGTVAGLKDLSTYGYNRVGVLLGDTEATSTGSAIGLLLGRIARIPVQRNIGRVRDLALKILTAFIKDKKVEIADVETIHDKGYITFRTFTGKAGYFFSDDSLATAATDDYRSIARRRTIDKAYRIAYLTLIEFLNDEVPITDAGELVPAMVKSWESEVEAAIINQMTSEGNLGIDPDDPADTGVKCFIDYAQKVVSTGKIEVSLKVKPYGYAKYIDVKLGFITINN
ncbi:MAG: DUF2586 family protein [Dysgonamonadaceae bacterium]|jgi:hypothetical protein|nr:DUF2586 family protein [Dysgonamonadaceae bacterium]